MTAARAGASAPPAAARPPPPAPWVRSAVRDVLERSPGYHALTPEHRQRLAHAMVKVSALASDLIGEELAVADTAPAARAPLAQAQEAQPFGESARRVAGTTRDVLNAVSFPRFVTELINGVFKAMLDSNAAQMHQYVELLNNVAASAEGFAGSQFSLDYARGWLADRFPDQFELETPDPPTPGEPPPDPDDVEPSRLRLRPGKAMPEPDAIRTALGMQPDEAVDAGNPEQLVPLARRQIARQRQQMLATMVQMGMQRIVIDSGKINAAMRFHIDTRSVANDDHGSSFNFQNRVKAGASASVGPWGASAEVENTIGYVSTQRSQSSEELNTDLDLSSSVEINFRSDYLPLNRMAADSSAERIRANSLNPDAEAAAARTERGARQTAQRAAEAERRTATNTVLGREGPALGASPTLSVPRPGAAASAGSGSGSASTGSGTGTGGRPPGSATAAPAAGTAPASGTGSTSGSGAGSSTGSGTGAVAPAASGGAAPASGGAAPAAGSGPVTGSSSGSGSGSGAGSGDATRAAAGAPASPGRGATVG